MKEYKWCLISNHQHIEFSNFRLWCRPAYDTLIKNARYEIHENGVLEIFGDEVIYHFVCDFLEDSNRLEDLNFLPDPSEIKKKVVGFFHKEEVQYVEEGWVKDSKTKPYHGIFNRYDCKFDESS